MNQITVEHKPIKFLPFTRNIKTSHPEKWDEMTPEQRSRAVKLLEELKPGKCEQALDQ